MDQIDREHGMHEGEENYYVILVERYEGNTPLGRVEYG